jgi:hypothetical protein
MKQETFFLNEISGNKFFKPLRNRIDVIIILLEAIRIIINDISISEENAKGRMVLHVDKMSRLFFFSTSKYFSINFPFFINNNVVKNIIYDKYGKVLDNKTLSQLMELFLNKNIIEVNNLVSFFDLLEDIYEEKNIWSIVIDLLTFEEGYIRFDDDSEHISELHPRYHIDIYYKESNKIKLGLENLISSDRFLDLIDNRSKCYFLNKINNVI